MSLCWFPVAPGETFTKDDIGKPVWAVAIIERQRDVFGSIQLRRDLMVGKAAPEAPLTLVDGFPLADAIGEVHSIEAQGLANPGVWVMSHEAG